MTTPTSRVQLYLPTGQQSRSQARPITQNPTLRDLSKQQFYDKIRTISNFNEGKTLQNQMNKTDSMPQNLINKSQKKGSEENKLNKSVKATSITIINNSFQQNINLENMLKNKSQISADSIIFSSNKTHLPPLNKSKEGIEIKNLKMKADFITKSPTYSLSSDPDRSKLERFFRSKLSSLISGAGRRQYNMDFIDSMKNLSINMKCYQKSQLTGNDALIELVKKLKKIASTRSKFKYREKIDFERSSALKALGYETKSIAQQMRDNQNKGEYADLEDEGDREQEQLERQRLERRRDPTSQDLLANWKRNSKINQKVFIIVGQYPDLKEYLLKVGWVENPNQDSLMFDLKWVTKKKDVNKDQLIESQITNHFQKNQCLTAKHGLALSLRNLIYHNNIDIDTFYPKCYDLSDVQDFEDFLEEFKFSQAESVLKQFSKGFLVIDSKAKPFEKYTRLKILIACMVIKRRTSSLEQKIARIGNNNLPIVYPNEWNVINRSDNNFRYLEQNPDVYYKIQQQITREMDSSDFNELDLIKVCDKFLQLSQVYSPQFNMNYKNSWIIKPGGLSRGRGIRSFNQLDQIINYIVGKDVMWVAQKYIENPMTIHNKKFDIRQWVLVTEWSPLTIYFYDSCYIRVCFEEYNPTDLSNKFAHLANNCISKHAENFEEKVNDTMMNLEEFIDYIKSKENGRDLFNMKIQDQMKAIAINSIKSCKDSIEQRKNSFELYGYDFMIDNDYNPWLIEVNSSPSMEYSTPVTTKLVKMCMEDTGKIINEHFFQSEKKFKKEQEFGLWKNIFRDVK